MDDVDRFLSAWAGQQASGPEMPLVTQWGNINLTGGIHMSPAPDLTPYDIRWIAGIESGVAPLVNLVARRLGWVTYDSCAGHLYPFEVAYQPAIRRVGILPRSAVEMELIAERVLKLAQTLGELLKGTAVEFFCYRTHLYSTADPRQQWDAVELEYGPRLHESWDAYFRDLDMATTLTIGSLEAL